MTRAGWQLHYAGRVTFGRLLRAPVDKQEIPRSLRIALYVMLIVAGAASVPFLGQYGPLPTTTLLDVWVVVFLVTCTVRGRTEAHLVVLALSGYLLTRIFPVLYTESPLVDAAQAYRWVLYLIAFAMAVGRKWGPIGSLAKVTWALLLMAFTKSAATYLVVGPGERPGLLLENNFELALFAGLAGVLYNHISGRQRFWMIVVLGCVVALSGSRSGAVAFVILALFAATQLNKANVFVRYVVGIAIVGLGVAAYWVFEQRAAAVTRVDRLNFLDVFLGETHDWTLLTWIFGTTPITELSYGACMRLSYYQVLWSSTGDGSCYSVILHAFLMRVIFDAGLIGLAIAVFVPWYLMRRAGVATGLTVALVAIGLANAFSVSGINNPYVALPMLLAILTARTSAASSPADPPGVAAESAAPTAKARSGA